MPSPPRVRRARHSAFFLRNPTEVGPEVIERARCDAESIGALDAEQPARVTATVTPRLRRQVFARDHRRCTVPGCRSTRNLDLHHIEYQRNGGTHDLRNITIVCSGHHQQLHEGALTIRGNAPDALVFAWREPPHRFDADRPDVLVSMAVPVTTFAPDPYRAAHASGAATGEQNCAPHEQAAVRREAVQTTDHADNTSQASDHLADRVPQDARRGATVHVCATPCIATALGRTTPRMDTAPGRATPRMDAATPRMDAAAPRMDANTAARDTSARDQDARDALSAAGYEPSQARAAVEHARPHVGPDGTLEQLIREALRCCAR